MLPIVLEYSATSDTCTLPRYSAVDGALVQWYDATVLWHATVKEKVYSMTLPENGNTRNTQVLSTVEGALQCKLLVGERLGSSSNTAQASGDLFPRRRVWGSG